MLIEVRESTEIEEMYGPDSTDALLVSALDFTSGAKVFTDRKVKAIKERPTRMLPYILWWDLKVFDFRKLTTMLFRLYIILKISTRVLFLI